MNKKLLPSKNKSGVLKNDQFVRQSSMQLNVWLRYGNVLILNELSIFSKLLFTTRFWPFKLLKLKIKIEKKVSLPSCIKLNFTVVRQGGLTTYKVK